MADNKDDQIEKLETTEELQPDTELNEELLDDDIEEKEKKSSYNWLVIVGAVLLVASIVANVWLFTKNRRIKNDSRSAIELADSLVIENRTLRDNLVVLNSENQDLERSLEDAFQHMSDKDILIRSLNKENETLRQIRDQVAEIGVITNNLNSQVNDLQSAKKKLNAVQQNVNRTIENKQAENKKIVEGYK